MQVLNLLHTRSLEEARAFLERSFGNYMGRLLGACFESAKAMEFKSLVGIVRIPAEK